MRERTLYLSEVLLQNIAIVLKRKFALLRLVYGFMAYSMLRVLVIYRNALNPTKRGRNEMRFNVYLK